MDDPKIDLSSLIEVPDESAAASKTSALEAPVASEPLQFETLEELSVQSPSEEQSEGEAPPTGSDPAFESAPDLAFAEGEPPSPADPEPSAPNVPGIDDIKKFSENMTLIESQNKVSVPFTLKIEGKLSAEDSERLLSTLSRENMGFREVDLEPQIAEGKILLPRISEYAGVLLIQALRDIPAKISFGPADEIFSTPETREDTVAPDEFSSPWKTTSSVPSDGNPLMPVTNSEKLPQFPIMQSLEVVIASGLLSTRAVEASASEEYDVLVEALIRELRFKAQRRGANGIVALQIQLTPLTLPTDYRVTVTGTAVLGTESGFDFTPPA